MCSTTSSASTAPNGVTQRCAYLSPMEFEMNWARMPEEWRTARQMPDAELNEVRGSCAVPSDLSVPTRRLDAEAHLCRILRSIPPITTS